MVALQAFLPCCVVHSFEGLVESQKSPLSPIHTGEESSFLGLVPHNDTDSKSVVGNKASDSGVVIGYLVGECTHTWSGKHFAAQLHI